MSIPRATRCFACGQPVGIPPALNRRSDGSVCPSCVDRLLEHVPAALPARPATVGTAAAVGAEQERSEPEQPAPDDTREA